MAKLMNSTELADYLGVPLQTIYAWRCRKQGPRAIRLGRALHWRTEDVEAWLDSRTEDLELERQGR